MMTRSVDGCGYLRFALLAFVALAVFAVGTGSVWAQGDYGPVTAKAVRNLSFNHYFTPDKKSHTADFQWVFTETDFVIASGKGPIPAPLLEQLVGEKIEADEVSGQWKLNRDGSEVVLSQISVGPVRYKKSVTFAIYKTAPTVVRIGDPQFVFSVETPTDRDPVRKEKAGIQGVWKLTSLVSNGTAAPAELMVLKLVFVGDKLAFVPGEPGFTNYIVKLNPKLHPAQFDMIHADGDNKDEIQRGIYRRDGDTLKICLGVDGIRPVDFSADENSEQSLYILQREKR